MNNKSILMSHTCQKVGWCLLILSVITVFAKALFVHDIDVAWYMAKSTHIIFIISFFLICLSKEKLEDEMISSYRLKAVGITAYVYFVLFLILSLILELKPGFIFSNIPDSIDLYFSEFFLIILPILLFVLYYVIFKCKLWKSKLQQAL